MIQPQSVRDREEMEVGPGQIVPNEELSSSP